MLKNDASVGMGLMMPPLREVAGGVNGDDARELDSSVEAVAAA